MRLIKIKNSFFIYCVGQAFNLISPLILIPFIISKCGLDGLGKISLGLSTAFFLILIVDYSYEIKGIKYISQNRANEKKIKKFFATAIFNKLLLFILATILLGLVFLFSSFFASEKALFLFSLTPVFAQAFNPTWFLQALEKYQIFALVNILSKCLYLALVLLLVISKSDYIYVNFFLGLSSLVVNVIFLIGIINVHKISLSDISFKQSKIVLIKEFPLCVSQLLLSVKQQTPIFLSGLLLSYNVTGQYKIIEQIYSLFRSLIQLYLRFFYSKLCLIITQNKLDAILYWKKYTLYLKLLVLAGLIFIFFNLGFMLEFLHIKSNTYTLLNNFKVSLIISFLFSLNLPLEQLIFAFNKSKQYIIIVFIVTLVNISLSIILIRSFQILGIIISVITTELLQLIAYKYILHNDINKNLK